MPKIFDVHLADYCLANDLCPLIGQLSAAQLLQLRSKSRLLLQR